MYNQQKITPSIVAHEARDRASNWQMYDNKFQTCL